MKSSETYPHSLSVEDVLRQFSTHPSEGLSEQEANARLKNYGHNRIVEKEHKSLWHIFFQQFKSPIVLLLFVAAGLSFWFAEWMDAIAILVVLLINAIIGFYMEHQAERSMEALKKLSSSYCKVIRDSQLLEVNAELIVPGDIVFVEAGDMIPADGRILSVTKLLSDESPLTGESVPVEKSSKRIDRETTLAERTNMLYKGTFVSHGNAYFIITATGMQTELGHVANMVQTAQDAVTPLEVKLQSFSKKLINITIGIVGIILIAGLLYGQKLTAMLNTSIALAVAAVPEGLPIVATLALAQGMLRMARRNVIVKRLSAVETLGGTNVICTDKTGTLTKNKIEVTNLAVTSEAAKAIINEVAVLCNTAEIYLRGKESRELGDPLEIGLLRWVQQNEININALREFYPKLGEEPFSSETKIMCTLHRKEEQFVVYAKGAAEELIQRCTRILLEKGEEDFDPGLREKWLKEAEQMAATGLRVIAAACRFTNEEPDQLSSELVFCGLIGMMDPPREDVFGAIEECKSAGIKIIMITGDHPATAKTIAAQLNVADPDKSEVINGKTMRHYEDASDDEKTSWYNAFVFARVSPKQKLDIINVLQDRHNVVAMTGDGINDAPALKKADIGIAMGLRGTQVAQEVSDMIIKDDSFSSIVVAIKQGRVIFVNIRKFVTFLLSCNLSEILVIATGSIFNLPFQLFPLQILFINLITDVLPALSLGVTNASGDIMKQPPRNMHEPIIDKKRWFSIIIYSVIIALTSVGSVVASHYAARQDQTWDPKLSNNILFFTLIFGQLFHVFNMNEDPERFFSSEVLRNRYVWGAVLLSFAIVFVMYLITPTRDVLSLYEMHGIDWLISLGCGLLSFFLINIIRRIKLVH
jgi:Ca2+-transporting ATPase